MQPFLVAFFLLGKVVLLNGIDLCVQLEVPLRNKFIFFNRTKVYEFGFIAVEQVKMW